MEDIILDCDPGHDDAIALILAVYSSQINLLGVTTSAGNQEHSQTLRNAMSLLTLMNINSIPVASGNRTPLLRSLISGVTMHGVSGLDGAELPIPNFQAQNLPAIELIAKLVSENPNKTTLVITGPCTNIALFLAVHPDLKSKIKQLVILGGGRGVGNWQLLLNSISRLIPKPLKLLLILGYQLL
ncbi:nucleoside hydrolase [Secundilactobacillus odoratitofui]|uniref:nucleoside hydrolase n=1 Tax=Secundilactobacillus odoratitofui TaxID=480930 RepID=UPI000AE1E2A4